MAEREPEFHPEASAEATEAYAWYFERSPSAAASFEAEVDRTLERALTFPDSGTRSFRGTRSSRVHGFPYLLIYRPRATAVGVIPVAHTSRRPGYWRHRL